VLGSTVGPDEGAKPGDAVGRLLGVRVGFALEKDTGTNEGAELGEDGRLLGNRLGIPAVGSSDSSILGFAVGAELGSKVGIAVKGLDGAPLGKEVGLLLVSVVGKLVGLVVGLTVDGFAVGFRDG
jgi:hypothetical protein